MKHLKYSSRFIAFGLFCFLVGLFAASIGTMGEPARIFTLSDFLTVTFAIAAIMWVGIMAGTEHEENK